MFLQFFKKVFSHMKKDYPTLDRDWAKRNHQDNNFSWMWKYLLKVRRSQEYELWIMIGEKL